MPSEPVADDFLDQVLLPWLAANGIDAGRIPANAPLTLAGDRLTTEMVTFDEDGGLVRDGTGAPLRRIATFTVTVPMPDLVAAWVKPKCPTCGR